MPGGWRERCWWLTPTLMALLPPVGLAALFLLGSAGWRGYARAAQGLMLLSVFGGPVVGLLVLWAAGEAGLEPPTLVRARWAARVAVVAPFLTLSFVFWLASKF
jgi:hypothetical protein